MTEREAHILLNMMEKVGPVAVRAMVEVLGSAGAIFRADARTLTRARGVGPETAGAVVQQREQLDLDRELAEAEELGARIVTPVDEEYPAPLLEIHDPPLALYVQGSLVSRDRHAFAVVGTRRPSHYGRETAERLAFQLAKAGFVVISGLAEGIDTAAHRGTLKAQGRTMAVLGGALDCMYPVSNTDLAEEITQHGVVMSEFPLGRRPDKTTFPMRNRIVSGLALGIIVVEAAEGSGALITARQALEQGRSVFAVPGRVDSPLAQGCNGLIRGGATLIRGVDDVLDDYEYLFPRSEVEKVRSAEDRVDLTDDESTLVTALDKGENDVDSLIRDSGLQPAAVSSLLLGLEMKKVVRMMPGRMVELVRSEALE